jgi:signal transduction histidine kinase
MLQAKRPLGLPGRAKWSAASVVRRMGAEARATPRRRVWSPATEAKAVTIGLVLLAIVLASLLAASDLTERRGLSIKVTATLGAAGFIAAGLLARRRHPTEPLWLLMLAAACAWPLGALRFTSEDRLVFTFGLLAGWLWAVLLGHIALAFPTGRLRRGPDRLAVGAAYLAATVGQATWVLFAGRATFAREECPECPLPVISLGQHADLATSVILLERVVAGAAAVAIGILLLRRWRTGSTVHRRSLAPVLAVGGATAVCFSASVAALAAGWEHVGRALELGAEAAFVLLPFAFLGAVSRSRIQRTFGVSRFVEQLDALPGPDHLAASLASALGDDSLTVVYWLPSSGHYVERDGRPVALPVAGSGRAVTRVDVSGRPVAALVHDASLLEEAAAVRAAGRAAALWLERDRLNAECRSYIAELRESRARLVAASDTERRRIERDLHDGAQQRLAGMLLRMKLDRRQARGDPAGQSALLDELEGSLAAALDELRALAAGILPPVLSDRGLSAALEELASRSPVPVRLNGHVDHRLPEPVEVAAYFVAAEALTNMVKHSQATSALVSTRLATTQLVIEIRDDGDGGVTGHAGTGLRGLSDRVQALGGQLSVVSPAGAGTTLRAEIPVQADVAGARR